ncbi:ATP-binding protein [Aestuariivita boseongensis]|uniref:ATP-binding protein n=1 Tax=Aestuariivita boseongensis TaxID=1470562 RepID=UPI0006823A03|nr:ATP-binding protein [Aestuariivita boseongensis]
MSFGWLKNYMPRGLYGRAALILIVPVVFVQLVVSIAFIQRHFEDVTTQMTRTLLRELVFVFDAADQAGTQEAALDQMAPYIEPLNFDVSFEPMPAENRLRWYDFSGRVMIRTMNERAPQVQRFELPDNRMVVIYADTPLGPMRIGFERWRVSASNPHQLLVTMVFFGALMTVIAYIYLRNQLRPITRLADAAQAFGRGRHVPYNPRGAIEVRAAGAAFLDMRARIERQIEQRTMMLSGVSHDLRTPLTRLKLGLSMLDEDEAQPLLRDVDDMQRLLDEFLNFAKGTAEGEPEEVDPIALIQSVVADAQREGKDVRLALIEGEGSVMLRPVPIRRAMENLIGNAVRYGTKAEVSVQLTDKSLRLRVEDNGPGIPEDKRGEALKPFSRLDPARNQNKGSGVGLGLAIASDIARAHGGVLRLGESESLGGLRADLVIAR